MAESARWHHWPFLFICHQVGLTVTQGFKCFHNFDLMHESEIITWGWVIGEGPGGGIKNILSFGDIKKHRKVEIFFSHVCLCVCVCVCVCVYLYILWGALNKVSLFKTTQTLNRWQFLTCLYFKFYSKTMFSNFKACIYSKNKNITMLSFIYLLLIFYLNWNINLWNMLEIFNQYVQTFKQKKETSDYKTWVDKTHMYTPEGIDDKHGLYILLSQLHYTMCTEQNIAFWYLLSLYLFKL